MSRSIGSRRRAAAPQVVRAAVLVALAMMAARCGGGGPTSPPLPPAIPTLTLTCPAPVTAQSLDDGPVAVSFNPAVPSGGVPPVTSTCSAEPGSAFPVGATTVTCSATDTRGVTATCSFIVTVQPPPRLQGTRFLAFGDSITYGVDSPPVATASPSFAYPQQLQQRLAARYRLQTIEIRNDGSPGEKAHEGGVRRIRSAIHAGRPDILLLMEGSNDLLDGEGGMADGIAALRTMIAEAKSLGVKVALATIPPQRAGRRGTAVLVEPFNERVRALALAEQVVLIDVHAGMRDDLSLIGQDDLHPTVRGFDVMTGIFFEAIREHFEVPATPPAPAPGLR